LGGGARQGGFRIARDGMGGFAFGRGVSPHAGCGDEGPAGGRVLPMRGSCDCENGECRLSLFPVPCSPYHCAKKKPASKVSVPY
jgi:hypothetical protein